MKVSKRVANVVRLSDQGMSVVDISKKLRMSRANVYAARSEAKAKGLGNWHQSQPQEQPIPQQILQQVQPQPQPQPQVQPKTSRPTLWDRIKAAHAAWRNV